VYGAGYKNFKSIIPAYQDFDDEKISARKYYEQWGEIFSFFSSVLRNQEMDIGIFSATLERYLKNYEDTTGGCLVEYLKDEFCDALALSPEEIEEAENDYLLY
jgi:hypothetical protein